MVERPKRKLEEQFNQYILITVTLVVVRIIVGLVWDTERTAPMSPLTGARHDAILWLPLTLNTNLSLDATRSATALWAA